jgi:UDP-N-acetylmuramoylalanine--D-glutamate ligase
MKDLEKYKGKKIGILGCDIEGKATLSFLVQNGFEVCVLDRANEAEFLKKNPDFRNGDIDLFLGADYLSHLDKVDVVFRTPGIPILLPELQEAIRKGVVVTSQIELFFELCPSQIIGVTGTKGKGTTSSLIYEMLKKNGDDVYLGGNIGNPAISFVDKLSKTSKVVLELSSFQLQSLRISPQIAVVLNVTQDHLDYHRDIDEYREAKKNIIKYQAAADFAVMNADYESTIKFSKETKAKILFYSKEKAVNGCYIDKDDRIVLVTEEGEKEVARVADLLLRGRHNLENVTAAILAAHIAGVSMDSIRKSVLSFKGLEHRLELVSEIEGIKYYNDSFSTTPETAIAAISSFKEPIVLILGGSSKGSDYSALGKAIELSNVKAIIFIGNTAREISHKISTKYKGERVFGLKTMEEMVSKANELAKEGDVVLLSPACASFGLFENYKDRGNQFKKIINSKLA